MCGPFRAAVRSSRGQGLAAGRKNRDMTMWTDDLARSLAPRARLAAINFGNTAFAQRGPTLEESGGVSVAPRDS